MKNNQYEVIVIGLGAMGSSASYYLSKKGIKVLGIDRFHPPHNFGSSHGHTRVIREAYHEGTSYVPIVQSCLLYTSPSPRDGLLSRMPSSA